MSPATALSFQKDRAVAFFTSRIVLFFSQHNPSLGLCRLISSPNPLSLLLARVYPLWLQPPPPAPFDCICFFFILSSPSPSLTLPRSLSISLSLCAFALSPTHPLRSVCLPLSSRSILSPLSFSSPGASLKYAGIPLSSS